MFKNLKLFVENKAGSDDLFDRLNTSILNKHLQDLMENLTAKVFRTYNASITLQNQLSELTNGMLEGPIPFKIVETSTACNSIFLSFDGEKANTSIILLVIIAKGFDTKKFMLYSFQRLLFSINMLMAS